MLYMYALGVIVGVLVGILISGEFQRFNISNLLKTFKKELLRAYEEGVKYGAVQLKIERINEISKTQIDYMGSLERPNASAAHARHKNSLVSQVKALEEEKIALFKSMLEGGVDPLLTVMIDGATKNIRASELLPMIESGYIPQDETPQTKTDSNSPVSARTKLHVVKFTQENTDDGSKSNPGDPAVH
jgi:hypothetical protein